MMKHQMTTIKITAKPIANIRSCREHPVSRTLISTLPFFTFRMLKPTVGIMSFSLNCPFCTKITIGKQPQGRNEQTTNKKREERERECVCVCVCVCARARARRETENYNNNGNDNDDN